MRAKLFQCQYAGIDLPFTSNYSSCGDGRRLRLYPREAGGTSSPRAFAGRGFHATLEKYAAESECPVFLSLAKAGVMPVCSDGGCRPSCDPGCIMSDAKVTCFL